MSKEDKLITDLYNVATILKSAQLTDKGTLFHREVLEFISNPHIYLLAVQKSNANYQVLGYADVIISGKILFRYISNAPREDTVFEIFKGDDGGVKISVYGPAEKRVLKNQDFASGSNLQKLDRFPTKLKCEAGTLQKVDDGYFVMVPPKIILYN